MASTYLTLINNVLRDINEVELTSSSFSSSRGVQTSVTGPLHEQRGY